MSRPSIVQTVMKWRRQALVIAGCMTSMLLFQNCTAKVSFQGTTPIVQDAQPVLPSQVTSSLPDPAAPVQPEDIPMLKCASYKVITADTSGVLQVPARDDSATCFVYKAISGNSGGASNQTPDRDPQVRSANHGIDGDTSLNPHPYLMGKAEVIFQLAGVRRLSVSGAPDQVTSILVDNYLLVGFGATSAALAAPDYRAYGTADASDRHNGTIEFEDQPVPLHSFASGGVASIGNVDISQAVSPGASYQLDLRAEDCGGQRGLSDIYVIFQ